MTVTPYPFGTEWTCVVCEATYPADTSDTVCPKDGGHLHRVKAAVGDRPATHEEKMHALRTLHDSEDS